MASRNKRKYAARPQAWGIGTTQAGNPQAEISFQVVSAEAAGDHHTYFGSFSEGALKYTMQALWNCGFVGVDLATLTTTEPADVEVQLVVEDEEYPEGSGTWRTKVKWVNKAGGLVSKPLEGGELTKFAAGMKGLLAGLDPEQAKKKPTPKAKAADPVDDIPF